mmetsp:Transcript_20960/g.45866  ORF Transcript_20960/g.45866 Transcript_20960/m.45866 type:complete len:227 (-) Transcript_20960:324-1004(-)
MRVDLNGAGHATGTATRKCCDEALEQGIVSCSGNLLCTVLEEHRALTQGPHRRLQSAVHLGGIKLTDVAALTLDPPAQPLICSLLVCGHELHELQACTLVMGAQQGAAVLVDLPHPGQRGKEVWANLLALKCCNLLWCQLVLLQELPDELSLAFYCLQLPGQALSVRQQWPRGGLAGGQHVADHGAAAGQPIQVGLNLVQSLDHCLCCSNELIINLKPTFFNGCAQ